MLPLWEAPRSVWVGEAGLYNNPMTKQLNLLYSSDWAINSIQESPTNV